MAKANYRDERGHRVRAGVLLALLASAFVVAPALSPDRVQAATVVVDDLGDAAAADGNCTLREAIETTNDNEQVGGALAGDCAAGDEGPAIRDTIQFSFGPAVQTIAPATELPVVTDQLEIDGRNGTADGIRIEIDGGAVAATGGSEHGLFITTGSDGSYLHHIAVFDFPDDGIHLFTDENRVERVISGMDQQGDEAAGNGRHGITIGGDQTTIEDSFVSGNATHGISVDPTTISTGDGATILGNRIGTTRDGTAAVPNGGDGINAFLTTQELSGATTDDITIGGPVEPTPAGTCDGDCNLISGNAGSAVEVSVVGPEPERADGLVVEGNYVGTSVAGTAAIGNSPSDDEGAVKLVGAVQGAAIKGNLISGNGEHGIAVLAGASSDVGPTDTSIAANTIGLAADRVAPLPNDGHGIDLDRSLLDGPPLAGTTIGGTTDPTPEGPCDGDCNVISGNGQSGITAFDSSSAGGPIDATEIVGNHIGTDVSGTLDRGNGSWGIQLSGVSGTTVGESGAPNVISGNDVGVVLVGGQTNGNLIQSNLIGVAVDGATPLGNSDHGVEAGFGAVSQNTIGGIGAALGNTIAHNGDAGVMLGGSAEPVVDVPILGNSIFSNGGLGIDLRPDLISGGVTENGTCNELLVANRCQEFPTVTSAGGSSLAAGTLASDPDSRFRIEVFANLAADPSGNGEGERFLGAVETTTDTGGDATWQLSDPAVVLAAGEHVAATATELASDGTPLSTSEFSDSVVASTFVPSDPNDTGPNGTGGSGAGTGSAGAGSPPPTATEPSPCGGKRPTLVGTEGADRLRGTAKADVIAGLGGKDTIDGLAGNDVVCGGKGDDKLNGHGGRDRLLGGTGKDTLKGGVGTDVLRGDDGKDKLDGGAGANDSCSGNAGRDRSAAPGCEERRSLG
ncbi:MAG TPA: hypothetical protein VHF50_00385 [Solirubrobacterales bacterium]|nr:hypothetical protein [Solirubrobacterales bacterium]